MAATAVAVTATGTTGANATVTTGLFSCINMNISSSFAHHPAVNMATARAQTPFARPVPPRERADWQSGEARRRSRLDGSWRHGGTRRDFYSECACEELLREKKKEKEKQDNSTMT